MKQRVFTAVFAWVALAACLLSASAYAAHTSTVCPAKSATVANGGTVTIDVTDCDPFVGFAGIGPVDGPLFPSNGTATLRISNPPFRWFLDYVHNGNTATSDAFEFTDASGNETAVSIVRVTITITPPTSPIVVSPASIFLRAGLAFSQQLSSTGGTAPYTYTITGGALPPGLSMSPQGLISGTPTIRSAFSFTVRAQDSTGAFTQKTYGGTIDNPIFNVAPSPLTLLQGVAASMQFNGLGGTAPYTFPADVSVVLPPGLSLSASGLLTGTPGTAGTTNARILVNDSTTDPACPGCDFFSFVTVPMTVTATLPTVSIAAAPTSVSEDGATNLVFTVTRSATLASATVVNITTAGAATSGTDYTGGVATVTIPAGATSATINIDPTADTTVEPNETVILTVAAGSGYTVGASASATGTISNDDVAPPNLTINDVASSEGNAGLTNFTFTVSLSAPANPGGVTFDIATANGTATAGVDYVANSLTGQTIPAGSSTYTFTVQVNGDTLNELNETFFVNVTNVTGAAVVDGQGLGTITNDDPQPSISTSNVTVLEGNSGTVNAVVTVTLSAASGQAVSVNYATADGSAISPSDYTATSGTLTFTPGQTSRTITVLVNGDIVPETNETFNVGLSGATNATINVPTSVITITNDDSSVAVSPLSLPNVAFNASYNQTITATGGSGSYSFAVTSGALPGGLTLSSGGALTGTASAGGTFNFTVTATDTSPAPGPFTASQAYTITVTPIAQTITFAPASPVSFGVAPIALSATASSGLTTFTFSTTSAATICTVSGNTVTVTGAGTCALTATQSGNANYTSASANASIVINAASQTVTFAPASPVTFGVAPIALSATASSGLTTFTFSTSSAATICTVSGNTVTVTGAGTCALTATQSGNANFASASANANIVINAASQTVTFAPTSPVTFGVAPIALSATASSGLTIFNFSTSSSPTICTVSGNTVTITGAGSCALTATQPGNTNFTAASANANIVINAASQTVTFAPTSPVTFGAAPVALTATASSGLTTFNFSTTSASTICTVAGNTVTLTGAGTCALTATQPGNTNYASASAAANIVINAASQTVTFAPASPVTFGVAPIALSATATSGLTTFTFSTSSVSTICTVTGNTVTITGAGTCALTATQAGNANYTSASATASVVINAASQTVTFAPASPVTFGVAPIALSATASSGLTAFTFSTSSAPTVCTLSGNTVTITGAGTCALTATQPGNANFTSASANADIVINAATQTVTFAPASPVLFGVAPIALSATASSGLTAFTFATTSPSTVCTVSGDTLTVVGVGSCAITATQAGNANYQSATANANVVINVAPPGAPTGVAATAGNAQATIQFTAPVFGGGSAITGYTVSCTPGPAATANGASSPIVVTGLTNGVTYSCSVVATNSAGNGAASAPVQVTPTFTSYTAASATGSGPITASFSGGGATCNYSVAQFIPLTGHPASPPAGTAPADISFPHGLFDFTTTGCTPGSAITMTITYPQQLPPNLTQYWKYGPTPGNTTPHWYVLPATISGATATFTITDGGLGDDDLQANGTIVDQGGPGVAPPPPVPLPLWMLLLIALTLSGAAANSATRLRKG
jgi:large repetitive protein